MQRKIESYNDEVVLDLGGILDDYVRCFKRYWAAFLLGIIAVTTVSFVCFNLRYEPSFVAKMTYAVSKTGDTVIDASIAKRLSQTVQTITSSKEFSEQLTKKMSRGSINRNFQILAENTEGSNLFTISVSSNNYKNANTVLKLLEEVYPDWASKISGTVELQIVDQTKSQAVPVNPYSLTGAIAKSLLISLGCCFAAASIFVLTIKTVRKESDMRKITGKTCLTAIPKAERKKRKNSDKEQLLINRKRIDWGFKQSVLTLRLRVGKRMNKEGKKVLLISSSVPQEGKSIIAVNLGLAFAESGKKVLLIDADFRNPSVENILEMDCDAAGLSDYLGKKAVLEEITVHRQDGIHVIRAGTIHDGASGLLSETRMKDLMDYLREKYDVIVIDTPPSSLFSDAAMFTAYADFVLYIVRHDYADIKEVREGMTALNQDDKVLGYVINQSQGGFSSYAKYGYGKYKYHNKYVEAEETVMNTEETL